MATCVETMTRRHTQEWRDQVSTKLKGRSPWNKGMKMSEAYCKKISQARIGNKNALGLKHTELTKIKISKKSKGHHGYWNGKKHSEETREKISKKLSERFFSIEHKKRLSESAIGRKLSDETKKIIREKRLLQITPKKDTKPERMLQMTLTLCGLDFEKHKPILGQPDIFIAPNICIFVDGDYFHANPDRYLPDDYIISGKKAADVWARDTKINHKLTEDGYQVIRIWESTILKNVNNCAERIIDLIKQGGGEIKLQRV